MSDEQDLDVNDMRLLRELTDELKAAPAPELDWERIEAAVMQRTQLEAAGRRRAARQNARRGSWANLGAFAVAAAAFVLLIAGASQRNVIVEAEPAARTVVDVRSLPTFPQDEDALPRYRVGGLKPGSVVQAGAEPVQLSLEGVATWTLGANSRAVVRTIGVPHVVELEAGTLLAEVVPRHDTDSIVEAFVVEVGGTRVAVHGTVFSVEHEGDQIHVEVTRGAVTVGPASSRGPTSGMVLASPARAVFVAATGAFVKRLPMRVPRGASAAREVVPSERPTAELEPRAKAVPGVRGADGADVAIRPAVPPRQAAVAERSVAVANPANPASTEEPETPPTAPEPVASPRLSVGQAGALISSCLRQNAKEKTFVISSMVTVRLGADGEVRSMQFSPPLNPKFQSRCGGLLFGRQLEGGGSASFAVSSQ